MRSFEAPRHLDRPKQWVHTPWLLLGMLFITALLLSSQKLAPVDYDGVRTPFEDTSQEDVSLGDR